MPVPRETKKLGKPLMRDEVYADLRNWIIAGILEPGEKLRDVELADALGVSRMPVREALLRLEDEGLVETAANRWTRVASVDLGQAERIYPIVVTLEGLALRLAAPRLEDADLRLMEEANRRLKAALEEGSPVEASEADRDFHSVFVEKSGNEDLIRMLDDVKAKLRRLEVAYFGGCIVADRSAVEHAGILCALRENDVERAGRAIEDNWRRSLERALEQAREEASSGGGTAAHAGAR